MSCIILLILPDQFLIVIGGITENGDISRAVDLVSLDPINHPVPARLQNLARFPTDVFDSAGGLLNQVTIIGLSASAFSQRIGFFRMQCVMKKIT
jgi:hypothetical protein